MSTVSKTEAVELLTKEVENLPAVDLLEIHNELFPDELMNEEQAFRHVPSLTQRIVDYLHSGLAIDEVVDHWPLIFPGHRNIWYDEEEDRIHYHDKAEALFGD